MKEQTIHEKAIRLIEGGLVNVDGHCVKMKQVERNWDSCTICNMDCLCHRDTEMFLVCNECELITLKGCYLELVTNDKELMQ